MWVCGKILIEKKRRLTRREMIRFQGFTQTWWLTCAVDGESTSSECVRGRSFSPGMPTPGDLDRQLADQLAWASPGVEKFTMACLKAFVSSTSSLMRARLAKSEVSLKFVFGMSTFACDFFFSSNPVGHHKWNETWVVEKKGELDWLRFVGFTGHDVTGLESLLHSLFVEATIRHSYESVLRDRSLGKLQVVVFSKAKVTEDICKRVEALPLSRVAEVVLVEAQSGEDVFGMMLCFPIENGCNVD